MLTRIKVYKRKRIHYQYRRNEIFARRDFAGFDWIRNGKARFDACMPLNLKEFDKFSIEIVVARE